MPSSLNPQQMSDEQLQAEYAKIQASQPSPPKGLLEQGLGNLTSFRAGLLKSGTRGLLSPHPFQEQAMKDYPTAAKVGGIGGDVALIGAASGALTGGLSPRGVPPGLPPEAPSTGPLTQGPFPGFPPPPEAPLFEQAPASAKGAPGGAVEPPAPESAGSGKLMGLLKKYLGPSGIAAATGVAAEKGGEALWHHRNEIGQGLLTGATALLPDEMANKLSGGVEKIVGGYDPNAPANMTDADLKAAYAASRKGTQ